MRYECFSGEEEEGMLDLEDCCGGEELDEFSWPVIFWLHRDALLLLAELPGGDSFIETFFDSEPLCVAITSHSLKSTCNVAEHGVFSFNSPVNQSPKRVHDDVATLYTFTTTG